MSNVHIVFYVFMLRKNMIDPSHIIKHDPKGWNFLKINKLKNNQHIYQYRKKENCDIKLLIWYVYNGRITLEERQPGRRTYKFLGPIWADRTHVDPNNPYCPTPNYYLNFFMNYDLFEIFYLAMLLEMCLRTSRYHFKKQKMHQIQ